jgi:hypothetical protein
LQPSNARARKQSSGLYPETLTETQARKNEMNAKMTVTEQAYKRERDIYKRNYDALLAKWNKAEAALCWIRRDVETMAETLPGVQTAAKSANMFSSLAYDSLEALHKNIENSIDFVDRILPDREYGD